ncbi:DUF4865 family protein [Xanthomonas rydalmerensis]|uniref:DUF4865 family protein n=1 Tax=Xanthomonas rydalmerensis TaxID=3046274 RepID=A0ABZ0JNC7_9XANT|nr:DUF4865 family protein [Xanthomonas sp. DM-2023]WOS41316.1 DUF4865 family protein [Xanthomonas sp. DM-2023]WOS45501.1 DUF4865 family protein [Xanthomonas sp. DM-2023]WOS49680.1 DUF4865 family protein [Xanthomonas sp. DM-2023]WOS53860.1 DUF4865 family protein [Xanthomonas sp. DM-2023]WOS58043.1 DUF4865 family protein [Xanthomonas sp. DM-2023]
MIAMQYSIALPADYDMAIIRRRIADKGPLLDTLPGLQFKAYLVADRTDPLLPGRQNLYAPFYLWRDAAAMHAFLAGPAFAALCDAFGRPAVQTWMVGTAWSSAALRTARYATRVLQAASPALGNDPADAHAPDERVLATVSGYEPQGWTLLHFRLWRELPPADDEAQRYAVHHLSAPGAIGAAG